MPVLPLCVTVWLRWSRFLKSIHSEAVSTNLINKWGRGNLNTCLQTWRAETQIHKHNAMWAPSDIIMKPHRKRRERKRVEVEREDEAGAGSSEEEELADAAAAALLGDDEEDERLTQMHQTVTSLQQWSAHVDRIAHVVAQMNNSLLLEAFDTESQDLRRGRSVRYLQAVLRGRQVQQRHRRWLAAVVNMTFLLTPIVRKKILVRALRRRREALRLAAARRIQAIARGVRVRSSLGPQLAQQRRRMCGELLDANKARVGQRVMIVPSALYQHAKSRSGKVRISRPEFRT